MERERVHAPRFETTDDSEFMSSTHLGYESTLEPTLNRGFAVEQKMHALERINGKRERKNV